MSDWNSIRESAARLLEQPGLTVAAVWNGKSIRGVKTTLKREIVAMDDGLHLCLVGCALTTETHPNGKRVGELGDGRVVQIL